MALEPSIIYLAGLFDGEGSISIQALQGRARMAKYGYGQLRLICTVQLTVFDALEDFRKAFGGHVYGPFRRKDRPGGKPLYSWIINGRYASGFLLKVNGLLRIKKEQAKLALEFEHARMRTRVLSPDELKLRSSYRDKMILLNQHKGPAPKPFHIPDAIPRVEMPSVRGERNAMAKLTWEKVREIRTRYAAGETSATNLGREYGVDPSQIVHIVRNEQWKEPVAHERAD